MKKWLCSALFCAAATAANAAEVLINGDFETGDLTGWATTGLGTTGTCPSLNRDWNVGSTGNETGCSNPGAPFEGTYAAYNMFDAGTPSTPVVYQLWQSFAVPSDVAAATLSWTQALAGNISGTPRTFSIEITNQAGDTILTTIASTDYTGSLSTGWVTNTQNITAQLQALAGQTVNLRFSVYVNENWTGAAGLGLDAVSLDVQPLSSVPTLSQWALALLAAILGIAALGRFRNTC